MYRPMAPPCSGIQLTDHSKRHHCIGGKVSNGASLRFHYWHGCLSGDRAGWLCEDEANWGVCLVYDIEESLVIGEAMLPGAEEAEM